MNIAVTTLL